MDGSKMHITHTHTHRSGGWEDSRKRGRENVCLITWLSNNNKYSMLFLNVAFDKKIPPCGVISILTPWFFFFGCLKQIKESTNFFGNIILCVGNVQSFKNI